LLFPTAEYAIFFIAVFGAAWGLRRRLRAHKTVLLAASYAFYAFWNWRFLPLLIGISLLAAAVSRALQAIEDPRARKALLCLGVGLTLATLVVFKYLAFLSTGAFNLLEALRLHPPTLKLPEIPLPVGISFFAFHAISLIVDAFRRRIPVPVKALDALLYVAFFPQLIAGPILRAQSFLPQLSKAPDPEGIDAARALELIAFGLAKKVWIANFIAGRLVDPVFDGMSAHSGVDALVAMYGYAAQIYCDFSGYSDIAIGSALLLGYRMPANFDAPYRAASPQEFWHRWHISLSTWLRDYLFIPLGGSRWGTGRTALNLAVTMLLGGLWHGAGWGFLLWGAFHGIALIAHRFWAEAQWDFVGQLRHSAAWTWASRLLTFHFVCLGWVLFRSPSLDAVWEFFRMLGRSEPASSISAAAALAIGAGIFGQFFSEARRISIRQHFSRMPLLLQGAAFAVAVLTIEALGPRGVAPFIYFQF
jgi:D-alanyl-lipoteichoic acid acyltransferase DltB (MBOAT superfamily)